MVRRLSARLLLASSFLAAALQSGCADQNLIAPGHQLTGATVAQIGCRADLAARSVDCAGPVAAAGEEILGGQGLRVALRATNVGYNGGTGKFTFDATVENLAAQSIGANAGLITGVRVFFVNNPTTTSGTGAITVDNDSVGTFTGADQDYYVYPESLATNQISSPVAWQFGVPATVNTFAFTVLVAANVADVGGILRFRTLDSLSAGTWLDIAANSASDALAVGSGGTSAHFDGTSWTLLPIAFTNASFTATAALGAGKFVGVTNTGDIYIFDGKVWTRTDSSEAIAPLRDVWVGNSNYFVAVGLGGAVTYDNGTYTDEPIAGPPSLTHVSGIGSEDTAAVFASDVATGYVYVRHGGTWTLGPRVATSGNLLAYLQLDSLSAIWSILDGTTGYVVADSGGVVDTAAVMPDSMVTGFFHNPGSDTVYLATQLNSSGSVRTTLLGQMLDFPLAHPISLNSSSVSGASGTVDNAPGGGLWLPIHTIDSLTSGGILRWNGTSLIPATYASARNYVSIWGAGSRIWLASRHSAWNITNGVLSPDSVSLETVNALSGPGGSQTDVYVVDSETTLFHWDSASGWTFEVGITLTGPTYGVWADSASDLVLTAGRNGEITQRSGGTWTTLSSPVSSSLRGVWGCSSSEAWLVGDGGHVLHYVSGSIASDTVLGSGVGLSAVSGTGCGDVWVVGDSGHVFHWNGSNWTNYSSPFGEIFRTVVSRAPGEAYAGGFGGITLFTTSGARVRFTVPTQLVTSLWLSPNGDLYGVGSNTVFVGAR